MAKLKEAPIVDKDMSDFVENDSDFAFEMKVLTQLRSLRFECLHSGTYQDPVSDKIRQFDIRALKDQGSCKLALAVECKNLRRNRPLLLSAVPRTGEEAFHELLVYIQPRFGLTTAEQVLGNASVYKPQEMVGKKTDQLGYDAKGNLVSVWRKLIAENLRIWPKIICFWAQQSRIFRPHGVS